VPADNPAGSDPVLDKALALFASGQPLPTTAPYPTGSPSPSPSGSAAPSSSSILVPAAMEGAVLQLAA